MKCTYKNKILFFPLSKNSGGRYLKLAGILLLSLLMLVSFAEKANAQSTFNTKINRGPFYSPTPILTCGSTINPPSQTGFVKKFTGSIVKYTYTITNKGDAADIFDLTAAFQIGSGVSMGIRILDMSNNPITFTPSLAPNETYFFQLELTVGPNSPNVTNITVITATSRSCGNTSNANAVTYQFAGNNPPNPSTSDLEITKTASPLNPTVTDLITYTITVYNNGGVNSDGVIITDNIPTNVTYVSGSASTPFSLSGNTLSWNIGTIPIVGTVTKTFQVSLNCLSGSSVSNTATVSSFPDDANTANNSATAVTLITGTGTPALITSQPANATTCFGNTSFTVAAIGTILTYQWQVNTGSGFNNITDGGVYSGATTSILTIAGATTVMNGYTYQVIVSGTCGPSATSSPAVTLTVNGALSAGTINTTGGSLCPLGNPTNISSISAASGGGGNYTYFWQLSTDCINWTDIASSNALSYNPPGPPGITVTTCYRRGVIDGCVTIAYTPSTQFTVYPEPVSQTIDASPAISYSCSGTAPVICTGTICAGTDVSATFSGGSTGIPGRTDYTDVYEYSINGGASWVPYTPGSIISTNGLSGSNIVQIQTRRIHSYTSLGCGYGKWNVVRWTINPLPIITTAATAASVCFNTVSQTSLLTYSATTNSPTTYSITWNAVPANSFVAVTDAALPPSPNTISISVPANTAVGTYTGTITVKNANGCVSTGTTFTITINPKPTPSAINHN